MRICIAFHVAVSCRLKTAALSITSCISCRNSHVNTAEALGIYQASCTSESGDSVVIVRRSRILNSTFDAMKRRTFSCFKNLKVEFSGEEAIDDGGPRREFFRCVK